MGYQDEWGEWVEDEVQSIASLSEKAPVKHPVKHTLTKAENRKGGQKGGVIRASRLSVLERRNIARKGGLARQKKVG